MFARLAEARRVLRAPADQPGGQRGPQGVALAACGVPDAFRIYIYIYVNIYIYIHIHIYIYIYIYIRIYIVYFR